MNVEEKLQLLERMRKESVKNEYRLQYGKTPEEDVPLHTTSEDPQFGLKLRMITALFLFLVFCGLLLSGEDKHQKISEEILNCLQKDTVIGYNDTINLEEILPEFLQPEKE